MKAGIVLNQGDPRQLAQLAADAEAAGWDGVFTYDAIAIGDSVLWDPWVVLAAMAMATERVTLGAIVFVPTRRRPWKLAREALTLDHLSGGRLVLPMGLGALDDAGFANVGEPTEPRVRAEVLDETLAILDGLWSGEPFAFTGKHYRFGEMTFTPRPIQQPRIPIWVVGTSAAKPMARVVRWDGLVTQTSDPAELARLVAMAHAGRAARGDRTGTPQPFEIVAQGATPADAAAATAVVQPFADAGATWWIEADWTPAATIDSVRARVAARPPRALPASV